MYDLHTPRTLCMNTSTKSTSRLRCCDTGLCAVRRSEILSSPLGCVVPGKGPLLAGSVRYTLLHHWRPLGSVQTVGSHHVLHHVSLGGREGGREGGTTYTQ